MSVDRQEHTPPDLGYISLFEPFEVAYWTRTLGVSESRLKHLVAKHGTSVQKIREALRG